MLKPGKKLCLKLNHVLRALFQFMADIFKITSEATKQSQLKVNQLKASVSTKISVVRALLFVEILS